tara:strand:- start:3488 stop:4507 length:1020 start_codon:yes stop_codon:yes gene_type:complete
MKIIKRIISILLIFIALLVIASFFTPKSLQVEEEIMINRATDEVFSEVSNFRNWTEWSTWFKIDPEMTNEFSEEMGVVGSFNEWKSDHQYVGDGKQTVVEIIPDSYIKMKMQFGNTESNDFAIWNFSTNDDGSTQVVWSFEGQEMPFHYRLMSALFMKGMIEDSYREGLQNLKEYIENKPVPVAVTMPSELSIETTEAEMILSILDSTNQEGISDKLAELYKDIMVFAAINGMNQSGAPLAYYHTYSPEIVVLEAAVPVEGNLTEEGRIMLKEKPAEKVIKGTFFGDYMQTEEAHIIIGNYMEQAKIAMKGSPFEVYITDPETEVDTTKWKTEVYYPIN